MIYVMRHPKNQGFMKYQNKETGKNTVNQLNL